MSEFEDVFTDELGESDRMRGDPVQLDIKTNAAAPYHCWSPAMVSVHHEEEDKRMVKSMVEAGIIEKVSWSTDWCSRGFFVEKPGQEGKLRTVTDFQLLNDNL